MKKTLFIALLCAAALAACAEKDNDKSSEASEPATEATTVTTTAETTTTTSTTTTTTVTTSAEATTTVQVTTAPPTEPPRATSEEYFYKILSGGSTGDIVFLKSNLGGDSDLKWSAELDDNCKQIVWDYLAGHTLKEADTPDDFTMDSFLFAVKINGGGDIPSRLLFSEDKAYMGIAVGSICYVYDLEDAYMLQPLYDLCW